jgi:hypothetical protein
MFRFLLLWWVTADTDLVLGSLHHVEVGSATDVSETHVASNFRVKGFKVSEYSCTSKVRVTLRLTVSSVYLGVETHLGLMTRYLLLFGSYCLVIVGHPL